MELGVVQVLEAGRPAHGDLGGGVLGGVVAAVQGGDQLMAALDTTEPPSAPTMRGADAEVRRTDAPRARAQRSRTYSVSDTPESKVRVRTCAKGSGS